MMHALKARDLKQQWNNEFLMKNLYFSTFGMLNFKKMLQGKSLCGDGKNNKFPYGFINSSIRAS